MVIFLAFSFYIYVAQSCWGGTAFFGFFWSTERGCAMRHDLPNALTSRVRTETARCQFPSISAKCHKLHSRSRRSLALALTLGAGAGAGAGSSALWAQTVNQRGPSRGGFPLLLALALGMNWTRPTQNNSNKGRCGWGAPPAAVVAVAEAQQSCKGVSFQFGTHRVRLRLLGDALGVAMWQSCTQKP